MARHFLIVLFLIPLFTYSQAMRDRPKVGVVLSGGGAKGVAHISVLRAIEEAGVPVDYIAGTSMGAIIGGLYAMGYTTAELDSIVRCSDWDFLLSDRPPRKELSPFQRDWQEHFVLNIPLSKTMRPEMSGFVHGRNLGNMLARLTVGYHDSISFDNLRIPFACVATNLANGEEVDMRSGVLASAIRASMAIPGVFTPVVSEGRTLVDGGLSNNFPVDVARRMGADIVIGATVQRAFSDTMPSAGMQGVVNQLVNISSRRKFEENISSCDVHIAVNAQGVGTMDFSPASIDTMFQRGYAEARAHWPDLLRIAALTNKRIMENAFGRDTVVSYSAQSMECGYRCGGNASFSASASFPVKEVRFDSITTAEERIIRHTCGLWDNSIVSQKQIEQAVRLLNSRFLYQNANYSLTSDGNEYRLIFHSRQRLASRVGVGGRFDTEELATLLLGADFVFHTHVPSLLQLTARLSERYAVRGVYSVEPPIGGRLNFFYNFMHNDVNIYRKGKKSYNIDFNQQKAGVSFAFHKLMNLDFELGAQMLYYKFNDVLSDVASTFTDVKPVSDFYFSPFVRVAYNSQNRTYYPSAGSRFFAEYSFVTDHIGYFKRPHAFHTVFSYWETAMPLSPHITLRPRVAGRLVLGDNIPYAFTNVVGGFQMGKYVEYQLPFAGLSHMEIMRNAMLMADFRLHYKLVKRHYITVQGNLLAEQRDFRHFNRANYIWGTALRYGYDSKFGPVEAAISYSGECRQPFFYVNIGYDF